MLRKLRIEVEEETVGEAVEALTKYEHALQCAEAQRYEAQWPAEYVGQPGEEPKRMGPSSFSNWNMPFKERDFFDTELGRELIEEVIEYDQSGPYWRGRRVVHYQRIDTRDPIFLPIVATGSVQVTGVSGVGTSAIGTSGVAPKK